MDTKGNAIRKMEEEKEKNILAGVIAADLKTCTNATIIKSQINITEQRVSNQTQMDMIS